MTSCSVAGHQPASSREVCQHQLRGNLQRVEKGRARVLPLPRLPVSQPPQRKASYRPPPREGQLSLPKPCNLLRLPQKPPSQSHQAQRRSPPKSIKSRHLLSLPHLPEDQAEAGAVTGPSRETITKPSAAAGAGETGATGAAGDPREAVGEGTALPIWIEKDTGIEEKESSDLLSQSTHPRTTRVEVVRGRLNQLGPLPVTTHPRWTCGTNKGLVRRAKQQRFNDRKRRR